MNRIALIRNSIVVNVIESSMEFAASLGYDYAIEHAEASPGWGYVNGAFVRPEQAPPVEVTAIERSDLLARMTPVEVHGWIRAAQRAQATNTPNVADRNALYAWTRWQALPGTVDLTSADILGLANVWVALGMAPARAQELLTPLVG